MKKSFFTFATLAVSLLTTLGAEAKVTIFAAASMTNALQDVADSYKKNNPEQEIVFSFASSSTLAKQIEEGAPADIFISASPKWMQYLSDKHLIFKTSEKVLLGNELVLIAPISSKNQSIDVAKGEWISALKDNYLSVGDPAHVPAGQYAEEALTKLNLWSKVKDKLARGKDVRAALALVERGESTLGIVYSTDAKVSQYVKIVGIFPAETYQAIEYPAAILKEKNNQEVKALFNYLSSTEAQNIFKRYGFSVK